MGLNHKELLDVALEVAMRHACSYSGYETPEKACNALAHRCKGFSPEVYHGAFDEGLRCWRAIEKDVRKCMDYFRGRFPGFSGGAIYQSIGWASYWLSR